MDATAALPDQPVAPDDSGSLSDHERSFGGGTPTPAATPEAAPEPVPATPPVPAETATADADQDRDDKGRYTKTRHRAKSQEASAEDVPRIRELTRRLREREDEIAAMREAARPRQPEPREPAPAPSAGFPAFDAWIAQPENANKTFEDFIDARSEWKYRLLRESERAEEAKTAAQRTYKQAVSAYTSQLTDAFYEEFPDFDTAVDGVQVSKVVERAVLDVGPRVAYYLAQHPEEREALSAETAIDPENPAFSAAVAGMRRYLKTLVATEQRPSSSPSRQAAVSTGSAPARVPVSVPRPPNPVRTAALRDGDQPPGDDSSLADHEKSYWSRRRA